MTSSCFGRLLSWQSGIENWESKCLLFCIFISKGRKFLWELIQYADEFCFFSPKPELCIRNPRKAPRRGYKSFNRIARLIPRVRFIANSIKSSMKNNIGKGSKVFLFAKRSRKFAFTVMRREGEEGTVKLHPFLRNTKKSKVWREKNFCWEAKNWKQMQLAIFSRRLRKQSENFWRNTPPLSRFKEKNKILHFHFADSGWSSR